MRQVINRTSALVGSICLIALLLEQPLLTLATLFLLGLALATSD